MKNTITILVFLLCISNSNAQCWSQIAAGEFHTLAIKIDGTLWAWGRNDYGQLGDGTLINKNTPTQIGTDTNWSSVAIGFYHSIAKKTTNTLWAWGYNASGRLGDGTIVNKSVPTQVGTATTWSQIAAGADSSYGIIGSSLFSWGTGALGFTTTTLTTLPTLVGTGFQFIAATGAHCIAKKTNGTLWSWGAGSSGQLGNGANNNVTVATQIGTSTDWQSVGAGFNFSAAIKTNGTLWTTGNNNDGALGIGTNVGVNTFTQVGTLSNWLLISQGRYHSAAIKTDFTLWTWGRGTDGALGLNTSTNFNTPQQVGTLNTWQKIDAGGDHTIATRNGGSLWAFGRNLNGQLGDGTNIGKFIPIQISCGALATDSFESNSFKIYPNPANDKIFIQNNDNLSIENIIVYDISGKKILLQNNNFSSIDIQNLEFGIYFLQIKSDNKTSQIKFIKN